MIIFIVIIIIKTMLYWILESLIMQSIRNILEMSCDTILIMIVFIALIVIIKTKLLSSRIFDQDIRD